MDVPYTVIVHGTVSAKAEISKGGSARIKQGQ